MTDPINLAALRENIGDDRETEIMLFDLFLDSLDETIATLRALNLAALSDDDKLLWKREMHKVKGASLNAQANTLAELALFGEKQGEDLSLEQKKEHLDKVCAELENVRAFIKAIK